ncbi:MAG: hypothetical protein Q4P20_10760 [Eubacteriales bacterium]|nr:hypothetical protein [Eubacteriales bacterium]
MPYIYLASSFTDLLKDIIGGIFRDVLSPVLESVFNTLIALLGDLLWRMLGDIMLDGFIILLKLVNFLDSMFKLFSGLAVVTVDNGSQQTQSMSFLSYLFQLNGLSKAFAVISVLAAILAFLFSMYATGKSMADMPFDSNTAPISRVLQNGLKSAVTFLIIPFLSIFLLQLSSAMLDQVIITFQSGQQQSVGMDDVLFIMAAQEAADNERIAAEYSSGHRYQDASDVKDDFDTGEIDYLLGYTSAILVLLILLAACLSFIRRMFELLLLYLISPFFAATIALDGGSRFKQWRDLFIGKFFSGFGSVFAMELYLIVAPSITGSSIVFSGDGTIDRCIKIFMAIGGAWAVYKGQNTFLQILNPEAEGASAEATGVMTAMAFGGVRRAASGAAGMGRAMFESKKQ